MCNLIIGNKNFKSRLFLGTGKFQSNEIMKETIIASGTEMVTFAMKRVELNNKQDDFLAHININKIQILPNTSGVRKAKEAVFAAQLSREAFQTDFIKLEIHPDQKYLLPDPIETVKATEELAKQGFIVFPYIQADPVLCKLLEEAGASTVMPLGSPIGSNKGIKNKEMLEIIIAQSNIPVIVDAGLGRPSDACIAMEMGADAVLVNTAIAIADDPLSMAIAFSMAVKAGRLGFLSKLGKISNIAKRTSPLTSFLE